MLSFQPSRIFNSIDLSGRKEANKQQTAMCQTAVSRGNLKNGFKHYYYKEKTLTSGSED